MSKEIKTGIKLTLVDDLSKKLKAVGENFNKTYGKGLKGVNQMNAGTKKLQRSTKDLESTFKNIFQLWAGAKALQSPFKEIVNRDESEFGLGTLTKNLESFKKLGREASTTGFYGYNDTIEQFYNLISGGMSESEAKKSFMQIQKFSKATRSDLETATKAIMTAKNVAKIGTNEASDVFTKTQYKYSLKNLNQLMEGYKQVAAVAKNVAHLKFTDTNVALGILNTNGIEGSNAGTALNAVLRNLPKLQEAGVAVARYKDGNLNLAKTFEGLREKYNSLANAEERTKFLQQIFGEEGVKAAATFISKVAEIKEGIKDVGSSTGLVSKQAKEWQKTLSSSLQKLKSSFGNFNQSLGKSVLPILIKLLNSLTNILNVTADLMDKVPALGQVFFGLASAFLAVRSVQLASSLLGLGKVLKILAIIFRVFWASAFGPVTLFLAALAGIIYYWKEIVKWVDKAFQAIKKFFSHKNREENKPKKNPQIKDYKGIGRGGNTNNNVTNHNNITLNVSGAKNPKEFVDTLHKEFEKMQLGYMGGK